MITLFCDYRQFSAKIGVFLKNALIKFLDTLAFEPNTPIFATIFFGENILQRL
jgi:hypothetical protein